MKKMYYILEARKMKSLGKTIPNSTEHIIGLFSTVEKAVAWMKKNGLDYFMTDKQFKEGTGCNPRQFYALLTGSINSDEIVLHQFYNMAGDQMEV